MKKINNKEENNLKFQQLLNKVEVGNKNGASMENFYNDVMDAYNQGILDKSEMIRVISKVMKG